AHFDVDYVGHRENPDLPQFHLKRGLRIHEGSDLLTRHRPVHPQRARRQHANVGVRVTPWNQDPPEIIQKTAQGIGYVDHQGIDIETLLGWYARRHPVRIRAHASSMVTIL